MWSASVVVNTVSLKFLLLSELRKVWLAHGPHRMLKRQVQRLRNNWDKFSLKARKIQGLTTLLRDERRVRMVNAAPEIRKKENYHHHHQKAVTPSLSLAPCEHSHDPALFPSLIPHCYHRLQSFPHCPPDTHPLSPPLLHSAPPTPTATLPSPHH